MKRSVPDDLSSEEQKVFMKRIEKVRVGFHLLLIAELLHDADVQCTQVGEGVGEGKEDGGVIDMARPGGRGISSSIAGN